MLSTSLAPRASLNVADLNNDGHVDIVVNSAGSNRFALLLGDGRGGFANRVHYGSPADTRDVVAADLDNDGDVDIVTAGYGSGTVNIHLNECIET